ncbi:MAG: VOC family protein [Candidatus Pacebacteria bacterium]|nr:VOC family protein [Candidatus Paceibacterota bacterium]
MLISGTVKIFVSDFEKSVDFYTEVIGCFLKEKVGRVFAKVEKSGLTIEMRPFSAEDEKGRGLTIGIGVSDFDAVLKKLNENEITFSRFKDEGSTRLVSLSDPDGVLIYLREMA